MPNSLRRLIFGSPFETERAHHTRLPNVLALPVFASDALSSVSYATEEILLVLVLTGASVSILQTSWPIGIAIALLLAIVATSYRQTIYAYPQGGGAYRVSRENLGLIPGLTAASALLIDYVLTVAVSISAGVAAITSAVPSLGPHKVALAIVFIVFVGMANLRGAKESGVLFAVPTYLFIASIVVLLVVGFVRVLGLNHDLHPPMPPADSWATASGSLSAFVILRAFSSGCTALTGVEAVTDGVPAFKPPEAKNAAKVLGILGIILILMFLGITYLAYKIHVVPFPAEGEGPEAHHRHTVISQIAHAVFGQTPIYYVIQAATAMILILAANTAFVDFPRLSMFLAQDRLLPRQFANVGDRLVFSNGIISLTLLSILTVVAFGASTHHLIPLYALGVFLSFTLSQAGMVRRWMRLRPPGWLWGAAVSGVGAIATFVVLVIIAVTKFQAGDPIKAFPLTTPLGIWAALTVIGFVLISMWHRWMGKWLIGISTVVFLIGWAITGAQGPTRLSHFQLKDPTQLAVRIRSTRDTVSGFIHDELSPETRALLDAYTGATAPPERLQDALVEDLNHLIRGPSLYDEQRFAEIRLSAATRALAAENPQDARRLRLLNRYLLEDAYPLEIERSRGLLRPVEIHLGAWLVMVAIPVLVWMCGRIHAHYQEVAEHLTMDRYAEAPDFRHTVLALVPGIHRGIMPAVKYARSIGDDVRAVYVEIDPAKTAQVLARWGQYFPDIPLVVLESPYRSLTEPILRYIDEVESERDDDVVTVVIPEFVTEKWWTKLLHGHTGFALKFSLLFKKGVVVTNVRYYLSGSELEAPGSPLFSRLDISSPAAVGEGVATETRSH